MAPARPEQSKAPVFHREFDESIAGEMRYGCSREEALAWIEHTDEPNARRIAITTARPDFRIALDLKASA